MVQKTILIKDEIGFHARTASVFAKKATAYQSDISILFNEKKANAKSTLSLMSLGVKTNDLIVLTAQGPDEIEAHADLVKLLDSNFNS
jgi:phosphocarrier protein HPr